MPNSLLSRLSSALTDAANLIDEMEEETISMRSHIYLHLVECDRAIDHAMQHVLAIEEHIRREAAGE